MAIYTDFDFVVAGATGWLGRATLDHLYRRLGDDARDRVHAIASSPREITIAEGTPVPVRALGELSSLVTKRPALVFHYAFRTKDRVGDMSLDDYVASNSDIRRNVVGFLDKNEVAGLFVPSSGAAYAGMDPNDRSDAGVYGRCKLDDERVFEDIAAQRGFCAVISRVFNLSGPYINKHELYALSSIILACLKGEPVSLKASHPVWRSYYAVADLIELAIAAMTAGNSAGPIRFDTVGAEVIEVGELAQRVLRVLGASSACVERPYVSAAPNNYYVGSPDAVRALEARFALAPRSLDRQIEDTAAYLRDFIKGKAGE